MPENHTLTVATIKDGQIMNGRVTLKLFLNLAHGDLKKVDALVMHQTGGDSAKGTLDGYKSASIGAHFLIDKDGTISQSMASTKSRLTNSKSPSSGWSPNCWTH